MSCFYKKKRRLKGYQVREMHSVAALKQNRNLHQNFIFSSYLSCKMFKLQTSSSYTIIKQARACTRTSNLVW